MLRHARRGSEPRCERARAGAGRRAAHLQVGAHVHGQRGQQAAHGVDHARPHRVLRAAALRHAHPQRVAARARAHDGRRRAGRAVRLRGPIINLAQDLVLCLPVHCPLQARRCMRHP